MLAAMADSRAVFDRLRSALVEMLPARSTVAERPGAIFCSDEIALSARILVRTEQGTRIAVIDRASDLVAAAWLGYDFADEVWSVDADVREVEQFGKRKEEQRRLRAADELRSLAVPGLVIALETIFGPPAPRS
jgi:hypothetical protein